MEYENIEVGRKYRVVGGWVHFFDRGTIVEVYQKRTEKDENGEPVELVDCYGDGLTQSLFPEDLQEVQQ